MARVLKGHRWTLPEACSEFKIDSEALAKRIKANGILAGEDGKYSTMQICAAKFGDIDGAKLRLLTAQALKLEREDETARRALIPLIEHERVLSDICVALRQTILAAPELAADLKSKLLQTLETSGSDAVLHAESSTGE